MQDVKVTRGLFIFNKKRYWRRGAESVLIGSWGEKKTPALAQSFLQPRAEVPTDGLVVRRAADTKINFDGVSDDDIGVKLKVLGGNVIEPRLLLQQGRSGDLELYKLELDPDALLKRINATPGLVERLRDANHARIVNALWVVASATMGRSIGVAASLKVSAAPPGGVAITADVKHEASNDLTFTVGKDTAFAYSLVKPKIRGTAVDELEVDEPGSPN